MMNNEAATSLAKIRVQDDTKTLKKTIREFYRLLLPDLAPDDLQAAHETFLIGVEQLSQHLAKAERVRHVTQVEVAGYRQEALALERTARDTATRIDALRNRLQDAQQERARRIEYDAIAKTIKKLPDRGKGAESIVKLQEDIALLQSEEATYAETWAQRQAAFDTIVAALESMSEAIRHEKMEQDRRKALEENDDDDVNDDEPAMADEANDDDAPPPSDPPKHLNPQALPFEPDINGGADEQKRDLAQREHYVNMEGTDELEEGEENEEGEAARRNEVTELETR